MTDDIRGWLTFDCYGTLVDWRTGMSRALESLGTGRVDELLAGYHRYEPGLQQARPLLPYREVLRAGLAASARGLGLELEDAQESVLADTMSSWPPFPETASILNELRNDGWRLGILSNVDNDIMSATLSVLGAPIDVVITSEDIQSYKPDLPHFQEFRRVTSAPAGAWVHVACSWTHDILPSRLLGVPSVFVNREREAHDAALVLGVTKDLLEVPDILDYQLPR